MVKRSRLWWFTNFAKLDGDYSSLIGRRVKYIAYGDENCKPSKEFPDGRPHHQGFIYFRSATASLKQVGKLLWKSGKCGPCDGTLSDNEYYCSKQTKLKEFGERPKQGTRMDIADMMEAVKDGASELDIAESNPALWCQYGRRLERYRQLLQPDRTWKTKILVYWGRAGTGKTRAVHEQVKEFGETLDTVSFVNGFCIGYSNAPNVLIDDFEGKMSRGFFLRLTDRYPMVINIKNGEAKWNPRRIYITSNLRPGAWYAKTYLEDEGEDPAVMRRLDEIVHMR